MKRALLMGASAWNNNAVTNFPGMIETNVFDEYRMLTRILAFDDIRLCVNWEFTKANVIKKLQWLRDATGPGDVAYVSIVTHGGQIASETQPTWAGSESDNLDEFFFTVEDNPFLDPLRDHNIGGILRDITMTATANFIIIGACHSGTGLRSRGVDIDRPRDIVKEATPLTGVTPSEYLPKDYNFDQDWGILLDGEASSNSGWKTIVNVTQQNNAILLAASAAAEVSWATYLCGGFRAIMNFCYNQVIIQSGGKLTYRQLHDRVITMMNPILTNLHITQTPQLECNSNLLDRMFLQ